MTWPPSELEWDKILEQLPAEARAATRTAVDAAVHDYSTDSEDPNHRWSTRNTGSGLSGWPPLRALLRFGRPSEN